LVDAPRAVARRVEGLTAGRLSADHEGVNVVAAGHGVPDAELAAFGRCIGHASVLREFRARIDRQDQPAGEGEHGDGAVGSTDRKSTRLNSSYTGISYAVFCFE